MTLLCGTWYGCVGVWVCVLWWDKRCDGLKKQVNNSFDCVFRLIDPVEKVKLFDWIPQSENSVEKIGVGKALFRLYTCKKARFGLQSKTAVFD